MNKERIALLEKFIAEDAQDPFNFYALGLEWLTADPTKAIAIFEKILYEFPDYLPAYYQCGRLLLSQNQADKAALVITNGKELARRQADFKTAAELQSLEDELNT